MFTVYALYNIKHGRIYVGQTKDLDGRLRAHKQKFFRNSYTSKLDGEWTLIYTETLVTRQEALKREKQLKSYRGREFLRTKIPV